MQQLQTYTILLSIGEKMMKMISTILILSFAIFIQAKDTDNLTPTPNAGVESVPMPGFVDVPIQQGMNLIGVQFVTVGSTNTTIGNLTDSAELTAGTDPSCADSIWIWKNNTYQQYHLSTLDPDTWTAKPCWVNSTTFEEDNLVLNPGDAFWLDRKDSAGDITVIGEVISDAQISIPFEEGKNLFSYPYSVSKNINDIDNSTMTAGTSTNNADSIWVWNNSGYDKYFLYAFGGPGLDETVWVNAATSQETNFELTIGKGYWFNAINQTTVTFTKPY